MEYMTEVACEDLLRSLIVIALFTAMGGDVSVLQRVNANFKSVSSRFASFFKGFIGAGGWGMKALKPLGMAAAPRPKLYTRPHEAEGVPPGAPADFRVLTAPRILSLISMPAG